MDNCEKYRELISAGIDGELTLNEQAELDRHLESCAECRRLHDLFSAVYAEPDRFDREPPAELTASVMETIDGKKSARAPVKHAARRWIAAGIAVAACVAVFFVAKPFFMAGKSASVADTTAACAKDAQENENAALYAAGSQNVSVVSCTAVKILSDGAVVAYSNEDNGFTAAGEEFVVEISSVSDESGAEKTAVAAGDTFFFTAGSVGERDGMICFQDCAATVTDAN